MEHIYNGKNLPCDLFDENDLPAIIDITIEAGLIAMKYFCINARVDQKEDGSFVTLADSETEEYIILKLKKLYPHYLAVGEETYIDKGVLPETYWAIDPIDGTYEFINDRDEFTVNIALVHNGLPLFGVIHAPAKKLTYVGVVGKGAYVITDKGERKELPLVEQNLENPILTISRSHHTFTGELKFLNSLGGLDTKRVGSSLKFCLVAEGSASFYLRLGTTMYWDTAAGHAIVKAAGGAVDSWESGEEATYQNSNCRNRSFMVYQPEWHNLLKKQSRLT